MIHEICSAEFLAARVFYFDDGGMVDKIDLLAFSRSLGEALDGGVNPAELADLLGQVIDGADAEGHEEALVCSIEISARIVEKAEAVDACLLHYHMSNAW